MRVTKAALLMSIAVLSGCVKGVDPATTLRVQLGAEPVSLDPVLAEDGVSLAVLANTMEGLFGYDGGGVLHPRMAESYHVSKDGLRYEFELRANARWSDGVAVKAEDFVTAFRRALNRSTAAKTASILTPIRGASAYHAGKAGPETLGVRAEGDRKLVIELERRSPWFIQALALTTAAPERTDVLGAHGGRWPEDGPSTGPYRLSLHVLDQKIVLDANPSYWGAAPSIPRVEYLIVSDDSTGVSLFEQGKLDILMSVPALQYARLKGMGVLRISPFDATFYLAFNTRAAPADDRDWRRAVAGAIKKPEIAQALGSGETPAHSWVPKGIEGYESYAELAPRVADSTAKIRARVAKQGAQAKPVTIGFDSGSRNSMILEKVQSDLLKTLGIRVTLTNLDWKSYIRMLQTDAPPIYRFGFLAPFDDPYILIHVFYTGDPNNYSHWSNAEYDHLVDEIDGMAPGPARDAKLVRAQEILTETEAVVVPIYHYVTKVAVAARVAGFRENPFGVIRFDELKLMPGAR